MNYWYILVGMAAIGFMVWALSAPSRYWSVSYTPGSGLGLVAIAAVLAAKIAASIYLVRSHIVNASDPSNLRIGIIVVLVGLILSAKLEIS